MPLLGAHCTTSVRASPKRTPSWPGYSCAAPPSAVARDDVPAAMLRLGASDGPSMRESELFLLAVSLSSLDGEGRVAAVGLRRGEKASDGCGGASATARSGGAMPRGAL